MEYTFSLTARLAALGAFGLLALLILLFALGVAVGERSAREMPRRLDTPAVVVGDVAPLVAAPPPVETVVP